MTLVRGTKSVLKLLGIAAEELLEKKEARPGGGPLFREWYANDVPVKGGSVILFVHSPTRLAVVVPAGERARVEKAFVRRAGLLFRKLAFPEQLVQSEVGALEPITYARTTDRSMIGSMNEIAFQLQDAVEGLVPGFGARSSDFEFEMSKMPHGPLGYRYPVAVAWDLIEARKP